MTSAQKRVIDRLRAELPFAYDSQKIGHSELKRFEVEERELFVSVFAVVGSKGDEGTMAAAMCRENRVIVIGKRGAVELINAKKKTQRKGWHNVMYAAREY